MAEYDWLTSDDDEDDRGGTDALKQARRAAKAATKRAKELEDAVADLRAKQRERDIADAIRDKGLDPKFAKALKKLDDTEFSEFLSELEPPTTQTQDPSTQPDPTIPPELSNVPSLDPNALALQQIQQGHAAATPSTGGPEEMAARIAAANSVEELNMLLHGNPSGPRAF